MELPSLLLFFCYQTIPGLGQLSLTAKKQVEWSDVDQLTKHDFHLSTESKQMAHARYSVVCTNVIFGGFSFQTLI